MKIKYISLCLAALIAIGVTSCKKAEENKAANLGQLQILDLTIIGFDSIMVELDAKKTNTQLISKDAIGNIQLITEGQHTFTFFLAGKPDSVLLDTVINIEKSKTSTIKLFAINGNDPLKIISLPNVEQPAADSVKISIANFSFLTQAMDIEVIQQIKSRRPFVYQSVGVIKNAGRNALGNNFTPYITVPVSISTTTNLPLYEYYFVPKDAITGQVILTSANGIASAVPLKATASNRVITGFLFGIDPSIEIGQF